MKRDTWLQVCVAHRTNFCAVLKYCHGRSMDLRTGMAVWFQVFRPVAKTGLR